MPMIDIQFVEGPIGDEHTVLAAGRAPVTNPDILAGRDKRKTAPKSIGFDRRVH